jgi:hypothetical protein
MKKGLVAIFGRAFASDLDDADGQGVAELLNLG